MKHKKSRRKIGHFSKKERMDICQMCDVKCYDYSYGKGNFRAKGHKLEEANIPYHECFNYLIENQYGLLNMYSKNRARGVA